MKPHPPASDTATYAPYATPMAAADGFPTPDGHACRLRVDLPSVLRWQRVNTLLLRLESFAPPTIGVGPAGTVEVRPSFPGCLVDPYEVSLDVSSVATIHVTPMAKGDLPECRLDLYRDGVGIQRRPLACRAAATSGAWRLTVWAFLAPVLWLYLTRYARLNTPEGAPSIDGPLSQFLGRHLPSFGSLGASLAHGAQRLVDWLSSAEADFRVGALLAFGFAACAAYAALVGRGRTRTEYGMPIVLPFAPPPTGRSRAVPPYLTPVSPEEMNQIDR